MSRSNSSAFSMIEVAVAIAVIAILAGAAAPLAMKALNQQREQKTRENMKTAYEALFGARDRRVSNMGSDFGYVQNPVGTAWVDLRFMTTRTSPNGSSALPPQPYAQGGGGAAFFWGWNGPYWTGPTTPFPATNGLPLDGWGRVIRLYNGPRIVSAGVDGTYGTTDDLAYPSVVGTPITTVTVNINRIHAAPVPALNLVVTVIDLNANQTRTSTKIAAYALDQSGSRSPQFSVNSGPVEIQIPTTPVSTAILDLLPGESKSIEFQIYD